MKQFAHAGRPIQGAVATQGESVRAQFIRKTYAHLAGAIFAFVGISYLLVTSEFGHRFTGWAFQNWFIVLGAFIAAGWIAEKFALNATSVTKQYIGLGLYIVAEAFIMTPLMTIAAYYVQDATLLPKAAVITLAAFTGLTAVVFITKKDFSFLRGILGVMSFGAFGLIIASMLFGGITLGLWFAVALVGLSAGYILYDTSRIMQDFPPTYHVAAALKLFADVALMFYYVLWILLQFAGDD
jgi:FtsH-binding integral membrane protein